MRWIDLLRMSSGNLKRRKLRTFLTILGVVIGTSSIVVMISLGLGMQESMYRQMEQSGGMTSLSVTANDSDKGMSSPGGGSKQEKTNKYVTDDVIKQFSRLEHVKSANPILDVGAIAIKGKYMGNIELRGMNPETLAEQHIELAPGGRLPNPKSAGLELVFGNGVITSFYEKSGGKGYYDSGTLPDINLAHDQMFLILDQDAYSQTQGQRANMGMADSSGAAGKTSSPGSGSQTSVKPPKKYVVQGTGVVAGDVSSYNANFNYVFCDLAKLEDMLKREFRGRVIPGQPSTKTGRPYKQFVYSSAIVKADNIDNVNMLSASIREMGYQVSTNVELMESAKKQFAMIQAVLGGIGAVSLFVAAIGIANTMMMSIYERTKEIGVIKVLGCSLKNIKQMFLLEAAFIGLIGGIVGNLLSVILSVVINILTQNGSALGVQGNISYIPPWLVLASMGFAVFVGMAAGYFPALRAMRLSPLAAIHNE